MIKRRPTAVFRCFDCSALFERRADHKSRAEDGEVRCTACSKRYALLGREYPGRRTGRTFTCAICGAEFYRSGSAITPSTKYCSPACRTEGHRRSDRMVVPVRDNSGQRNGRYKHGRRVGAHVNKPKVRAAVIERDGDWCLLCGRPPKGLHLHRVNYGSEGGTYRADNCVQLCNADHALVHSSKSTWKPLLLLHLAGDATAIDHLRLLHRSAS